ncbi:hypothetical protein [Hyperthermus butylicus]|uniref:Uncharacterized protein n=1 Tax=Hyperthermus butylicus (strain DSM 5456 / JCM 9403 / PLM1-5) TaxID=415426 RepID=A2BKQ6_HYPBU|nr:hypothetical protein [Hyperthermus butylicus]ABM80567.1 hypothetical protein Hbut_0712 [Hyperthermus butylicus DSM 5456]
MPSFIRPKPLATLSFVSFTPLWPGGPLGGRTYRCITRRYCIGPFLPDSKQVIGRVRWLLRTVEATLQVLTGKPVNSYADVESLNARIFGTTSTASKLRIVLSYSPNSVRSYFDASTVQALEEAARRASLNAKSIVQLIEVDGFTRLRHKLNLPPFERRIWSDYERYLKVTRNGSLVPDELALLLTIPRIRLTLQGIKKFIDIYEMQPLREGIELTVTIYARKGANVDSLEASFAVLVIVFTLAFIGLGKATSRGFGRFALKKYEINVNNKDLVDDVLESFTKVVNSVEDMKSVYMEAGKTLLMLARELKGVPVPSSKIDDVAGEDGWHKAVQLVRRSRVPLFATSIAYVALKGAIGRIKHPCPYATAELGGRIESRPHGCIDNTVEVGDIITALSAVGKATLKSTWKLYHGPQQLRREGVAYHTWPLGLPRGAQNTGYYIAEHAYTGERCGPNLGRIAKLNKSSRRLSTVFFTVACSGGECFGLVQPFLSYEDFADAMTRLVHVGKHDKTLYHVVSVAQALQQSRLGHGGCPPDPAGLAAPRDTPGARTASDVVLEPLLTALDWIVTLLG